MTATIVAHMLPLVLLLALAASYASALSPGATIDQQISGLQASVASLTATVQKLQSAVSRI